MVKKSSFKAKIRMVNKIKFTCGPWIPNTTFISPLGRKLIPYFILLFVSGYIFSDNFLRFIEFHSDVKVKQIKPVISGENDEETVTPRFPNLMLCSFQRIVQKYIGGHT